MGYGKYLYIYFIRITHYNHQCDIYDILWYIISCIYIYAHAMVFLRFLRVLIWAHYNSLFMVVMTIPYCGRLIQLFTMAHMGASEKSAWSMLIPII
jgi:hypothetical protein